MDQRIAQLDAAGRVVNIAVGNGASLALLPGWWVVATDETKTGMTYNQETQEFEDGL